MVIDREQKYREMVMRGKYRRLYAHLCGRRSREWSASFAEVEAVLGFQLPFSARMHRPWWANQSRGTGTATPWPGPRPDGRPPRSTWRPRRCCSGASMPSLSQAVPSTRFGPSTPPERGQQI